MINVIVKERYVGNISAMITFKKLAMENISFHIQPNQKFWK